jgi:hypothetical protein
LEHGTQPRWCSAKTTAEALPVGIARNTDEQFHVQPSRRAYFFKLLDAEETLAL